MLLVAKGITTSSKKLLVARCIATRSKDATSKGITSSSKKLLVARRIAARSKNA